MLRLTNETLRDRCAQNPRLSDWAITVLGPLTPTSVETGIPRTANWAVGQSFPFISRVTDPMRISRNLVRCSSSRWRDATADPGKALSWDRRRAVRGTLRPRSVHQQDRAEAS